MSFYPSTLQILDIEPSSFCNAKCPQCLRESRNGDYNFLNQTNIPKDFFEIYFPKDVVKNLKIATFSGNVGEPAMNKHLLDILHWFKSINPDIFLEIYTNGSVQQENWWKNLGNIIEKNGNVIFAIDGLEDTNHIYRVDVKWSRLIRNVKAYISTGATSTWQFIPFEHNEHQIDEARELSKQLGFTNFKIKISHRSLLNQPQNIKNAIKPATNPKYAHTGKQLNFIKIKETEEYLNSLEVKCYAQDLGNIYINSEGLVFPCCHTASIVLLPDNMLPKNYNWILECKKDFAFDEISLYKNSLDSILNSSTFKKIKDSWSKPLSQGKNPICAAICGKCNNEKSLIEGLLSQRPVSNSLETN